MKIKIFAGIIAASMAVSVIPAVFADEIDETYDDIKFVNTCDTELEGVTLMKARPTARDITPQEQSIRIILLMNSGVSAVWMPIPTRIICGKRM